MMVPCRECGRDVSTQEEQCVICGTRPNWRDLPEYEKKGSIIWSRMPNGHWRGLLNCGPIDRHND